MKMFGLEKRTSCRMKTLRRSFLSLHRGPPQELRFTEVHRSNLAGWRQTRLGRPAGGSSLVAGRTKTRSSSGRKTVPGPGVAGVAAEGASGRSDAAGPAKAPDAGPVRLSCRPVRSVDAGWKCAEIKPNPQAARWPAAAARLCDGRVGVAAGLEATGGDGLLPGSHLDLEE